MRTGVFGGTFNPVHLGHLLVADDVRSRLKLDRVLFIPCFRPPHKPNHLVPFRHRSAMTEIALKSWSGFELCTIEENRSGPSYTVDTLKELRSRLKGDSLYLIIGVDQYQEIAGWRAPEELTRLARLVVMDRPGKARPPVFPGHNPDRVRFLPVVQVDISAALIRKRLAKGESVQYMLPVPVSGYINRHRLYRQQTGG